MIQKVLHIGDIQWIFVQSPKKETIENLAKEYNLHEVIVRDMLQVNAQSKIEIGDESIFLALSFTKYIVEKKRYVFNELDIVIGKNYIITVTWIESKSFNDLFEKTKTQEASTRKVYKYPQYYILSQIIDSFYEKTIRSLWFCSQKLLEIQNTIADHTVEKEIIDDLVNEDLNKILIKNNFLWQKDVMNDLVNHIRTVHEKHLVMYFNALKVKLGRIINIVDVLTQKNDSLMTAYNVFVGIKSNNTVTKLTFINGIFLPLTLLASIGGMSERSMITGPENRKITYPLFLVLCAVIWVITYIIFRKISVRNR